MSQRRAQSVAGILAAAGVASVACRRLAPATTSRSRRTTPPRAAHRTVASRS
ncbi:hypothetical protein FLP41_13220 [Paracoccus marcusii]|uniref:hypothetical protein n=1 Tax=Paracoccus marcusii TaxID=59779 RepID=UPI002ED1748A|nr:hypothetical protein FLP41_13220 [Paracoccus marcusii]